MQSTFTHLLLDKFYKLTDCNVIEIYGILAKTGKDTVSVIDLCTFQDVGTAEGDSKSESSVCYCLRIGV
jgi:hypothetical protein